MSTTSGQGSVVGNRVKGATELVHGVGENVRGTVLGAVDTMAKKGPTKNDEIARQGRLEMERGLGNMKGTTAAGSGNGTMATNQAAQNTNAMSSQPLNSRMTEGGSFPGGTGAQSGAGSTGNPSTGAYDTTNTNMEPTHPGLGPGSGMRGAQTGYANDQQRQNEGTNGQNPSTNTYGDRGTDNMNGAQPQLGVGADPYGRAQGPGGFKDDDATHTFGGDNGRNAPNIGGTTTHPGHHREDAIAGGVFQDQAPAQEQIGHHQPRQNVGVGSGFKQAPYGHDTNAQFAPDNTTGFHNNHAGAGISAGNPPSNQPVN